MGSINTGSRRRGIELVLWLERSNTGPELHRTSFDHPGLNEKVIRAGRCPADLNLPGEHGKFRWTAAVQALTVVLLKWAAWAHREPDKRDVHGPRVVGAAGSSPARSLNDSIAKNTAWLCEMFGCNIEGTPHAPDLIRRSQSPPKVEVFLAHTLLPPDKIRVFFDDELIEDPTALEKLAAEIEQRHFKVTPSRGRVRPTTSTLSGPAAVGSVSAVEQVLNIVREHEARRCSSFDVLGERFEWEDLYQELSLLRPLTAKNLPHVPRRVNDPQDSQELQNLRELEIHLWEDRVLSREVLQYEPLKIDRLFNAFSTVATEATSTVPRFVVLGPPGSGKSALVDYLSWRCTHNTLAVAGEQCVPLRISLSQWANGKHLVSLESYLQSHYGTGAISSAGQWQQILQKEKGVLLLLDGLDEVSTKTQFLQMLKDAISIMQCPIVLTCRTISFEQHRWICPGLPVFGMAGFSDIQRDLYIQRYAARARFGAQELIDQLKAVPAMQALVSNPRVLSFICYVAKDAKGIRLPTTRTMLYRQVVEKLLNRTRRITLEWPVSDPKPDTKRSILKTVALRLLLTDATPRCSESQLTSALWEGLEKQKLDPAGPWAGPFIDDQVGNSGLLRGDVEHGYSFLHLTILEYLVAAALACRINESSRGWKTKLTVRGTSRTIQDLVEQRAWRFNWHEVVACLAGELDDPGPLLEMLRASDTQERHKLAPHSRPGLALAASCIPELSPARREALKGRVAEIITETCDVWLGHARRSTVSAVPMLTRALASLAGEATVQTWLADMLQDQAVCAEACFLAGESNPLAATDQVRKRLLALLWDGDSHIRASAERAISGLGRAVTGGNFVAQLFALMRSKDSDVVFGATRAIRGLGSAAATDEIKDHILTLSQNKDDSGARFTATGMCVALGPHAAEPKIREQLQLLMSDNEPDVRYGALWAIGELGAEAATADVGRSLLDASEDHDPGVRSRAATAIGALGPAAMEARPDILDRLCALLRDDDSNVRSTAAAAIGALGPATTKDNKALMGLLALSRNDDDDNRYTATVAIGKLGPAAAASNGVKRLVELTDDDGFGVGDAAVRALSRLGLDEARVMELAPCTEFSESVIGRLGQAAPTSEDLDRLRAMLQDDERDVRISAAKSVGAIGPVAASPDIRAALAEMLGTGDSGLQYFAAEAVGKLGLAAATPDALEPLLAMLQDDESVLRSCAARTIGELSAVLHS